MRRLRRFLRRLHPHALARARNRRARATTVRLILRLERMAAETEADFPRLAAEMRLAAAAAKARFILTITSP